jgi:hypothetical protein
MSVVHASKHLAAAPQHFVPFGIKVALYSPEKTVQFVIKGGTIMSHFTIKFWFVCGIAAMACLLLAGAVAAGQTPSSGSDDVVLSGFLTCPTPNGTSGSCPFRLHYVNLTQGKAYVIRMASSEFHAKLMLEDMRGNLLAADTDDFNTLPGCIVFHPPTSGEYRLVATSAPPTNEGFYTITIRALPILMRVEAALTTTDSAHADCFHKTQEVTLIRGRRYIIDMQSTQFEPLVKLLNAEGTIVAFDDEGCMPRAARIVFTAPRTGGYRLVATSASSFATGSFTLTVCED